MSNLLEDVFIVERLQILNEDKDHGVMKVRGVFQRADEQNKNGRVYSGPLLMREMNKLQDSIDNRRLVGELDHPSHDAVKLSQVSHLITKLEMKGKEVIGEAEILDTPMGKVAQALIKGGVQVGISSRGMGTLSEGEDGRHYVNEDFRLITWDLVADPSTRGAYPGLSESSVALANEICENMIPKVTAEKVFTTLLEEAFTGRLDEKSLDPVGQEDDDVDNDGDSDSSDKYLKARRDAIGKAMGKKGKKAKFRLKKKSSRKDEGMDVENAGSEEIRKRRLANIQDTNRRAARDLERSKKVTTTTSNVNPDKEAERRKEAADLRNKAFRQAASAGHKADVMSAEIAGNTTPRPRGRRSAETTTTSSSGRKDEGYGKKGKKKGYAKMVEAFAQKFGSGMGRTKPGRRGGGGRDAPSSQRKGTGMGESPAEFRKEELRNLGGRSHTGTTPQTGKIPQPQPKKKPKPQGQLPK